ICASTCSAGIAASASTSFAAAPGNGTKTFAMVTLIWGSSSRGVTATANSPSRNATSACSGVSCACWEKRAMRPEMPMAGSALHPGLDGIEGNALAGLEAREHLDRVLVAGRAEAHLAKPWPAVLGEHIDG